MTPSTTNTAERELLASALDECGWRTDAAEVREGRNPFVRSDHALAAIEKALTQQQANTSKQTAGEAQSEDMIDPVKIEISIPGELGKTIRFVERKWLYGNDQHHDDAPASARVEAMRTALTEHFTPPRHPADEGMADALRIAEAALADIGDADREPGDDVAWCERRAAQALPAVRAAIKAGTP